jgi:hypothetical protein
MLGLIAVWTVAAIVLARRRRPSPGRPLVVFDGSGIALPHLGVHLPWAVAVVDVQVVYRQGLCLRIAGIDAGVPIRWLSEPPERILAVARDHVVAAHAAAEG